MNSKILVLLAVAAVTWVVYTVVYRLFFHPLAKFPGLPQSALSDRWLYFLNKKGQVEPVLEDLHRKFGTRALRVGPNEIHITDVNLYKTIYEQKGKYTKPASFYDGFPIPHSLFAETNPAKHKERRKMMNNFFSTAGIHKIEHIMQGHVLGFRQKLERIYSQGQAEGIKAADAFRCVTVDIITQFAFAKSLNLVQNSDDRFGTEFHPAFDAAVDGLVDSIYNPTFFYYCRMLPKWFVRLTNPAQASIFRLIEEGEACWAAYKSGNSKSEIPVIFDELKVLGNDELVVSEAMDVLVAGSDTTTYTLLVGMWHIGKSPALKQKLVQALRDAIPDNSQPPSLSHLESIEYLTACMNESLRFASPVPGRLPRLVPEGEAPLIVDGMLIPPGSIVGMSAHTMHWSEELWGADVREFNPDRWLGEAGKHLEGAFSPFSKGVRSCIGQNLARGELRMMMAMLYRNFDIELNPQSSPKIMYKDCFTAQVENPGTLFDIKSVIRD